MLLSLIFFTSFQSIHLYDFFNLLYNFDIFLKILDNNIQIDPSLPHNTSVLCQFTYMPIQYNQYREFVRLNNYNITTLHDIVYQPRNNRIIFNYLKSNDYVIFYSPDLDDFANDLRNHLKENIYKKQRDACISSCLFITCTAVFVYIYYKN